MVLAPLGGHVELSINLHLVGLVLKKLTVPGAVVIPVDTDTVTETFIGGVSHQGKTGNIPSFLFLLNDIGTQLLRGKTASDKNEKEKKRCNHIEQFFHKYPPGKNMTWRTVVLPFQIFPDTCSRKQPAKTADPDSHLIVK